MGLKLENIAAAVGRSLAGLAPVEDAFERFSHDPEP